MFEYTINGPSFRAQVAASVLLVLIADESPRLKGVEHRAAVAVQYADALIAELAKKETAE